jgi:hypothetical protein
MPKIFIELNLDRKYSNPHLNLNTWEGWFKWFVQWFYWIEENNVIHLQKELTEKDL